MFRYKKIIGESLFCKKEISRIQEAHLGCYILNKITDIGLTNSKKKAAKLQKARSPKFLMQQGLL